MHPLIRPIIVILRQIRASVLSRVSVHGCQMHGYLLKKKNRYIQGNKPNKSSFIDWHPHKQSRNLLLVYFTPFSSPVVTTNELYIEHRYMTLFTQTRLSFEIDSTYRLTKKTSKFHIYLVHNTAPGYINQNYWRHFFSGWFYVLVTPSDAHTFSCIFLT